MAAHGLTICKQVRNIIDTRPPEVAFDYAYGATCAPGTCFTAGFDWDIWTRIDRAVQERDMAALISAVEDGIHLHGWMAEFRTLEDVRARSRS
jgi:hypothetical protein